MIWIKIWFFLKCLPLMVGTVLVVGIALLLIVIKISDHLEKWANTTGKDVKSNSEDEGGGE